MAGNFVWRDLSTADPDAAISFYSGLLGWEPMPFPGAEPPYTVMTVQKFGVGGITSLQGECPPGWAGYVHVEDVDLAVGRVKDLGGSLIGAVEQMEGVGRMAVAADPHGARFVLFQPAPMEPPPPPAPGTTGLPVWNELYAGELDSAFAFYAALFGWTKGDGMDMGSLGIYQQFKVEDQASGGMMTKVPDMPAPMWMYYFAIDSVEAAAAKVGALGGTVTFGPQEVPGGMWIIMCLDPQGNLFGLVSPQR